MLIKLCFCLCLVLVSGKKIPSYLTLCHQNEQDLNGCILRAVEQVKPHILNGIPELYIPSMNPFRIPKAELNTGGSFNASFHDIEIYDIHNFEITKLNVDLDNNKLDLVIYFPHVVIDSRYKIKGKLLIVELNGLGNARGNYSDIYVSAKIDGKRIIKKGREYMKFAKNDIDVKFGKVSIQFSDLFEGNKELSHHINEVINENIDSLLDELHPIIKEACEGIIKTFVEQIFGHYPIDVLFPK